jgi:glucokinase
MTLRLVGDVGGTNCRLAVYEDGREVVEPQAFKVADHATLEDAIDRYLRGTDQRPSEAVIAVAGTVKAGQAELTNAPWDMSEPGLRRHGFKAARLLNDYEALALSVDLLTEEDLGDIGGVTGAPESTIAIVGAGTGLGVGALVRDSLGDAVAVTEGGHIAFAPTDDLEIEVLKILTARFGRCSLERILSGPGLVNLYEALAQIGGHQAEALKPEDIEDRADKGDALADQTLKRFCRIYGAAAGDFALAFGAFGGVYLGGGIAGKIMHRLRAGEFRQGFEDKGRFRDYCAAIPTKAILHPYAALLGAAAARIHV